MHGELIMLIPMSEATLQEVHMQFIISDLGISVLAMSMLQKRPFWDGMLQSMFIFMLQSFMVLQS
jgi:hypothetical protein